jgi:hypothetical protein
LTSAENEDFLNGKYRHWHNKGFECYCLKIIFM